MSEKEIVVLNNDTEGDRSVVMRVVSDLKNLKEKEYFGFYNIVMKCKDNDYKISSNLWEVCRKLGLIQDDWNINIFVKNIILSATQVEWINIKLINPVKDATEEIENLLKKDSKEENEGSIRFTLPENEGYEEFWQTLDEKLQTEIEWYIKKCRKNQDKAREKKYLDQWHHRMWDKPW